LVMDKSGGSRSSAKEERQVGFCHRRAQCLHGNNFTLFFISSERSGGSVRGSSVFPCYLTGSLKRLPAPKCCLVHICGSDAKIFIIYAQDQSAVSCPSLIV
jgi:hypothetical protein